MRIAGERFVDAQERTLLLRGVNLGANARIPKVPGGGTWNSEGFFEHRDVSFVGRPFPLEEAGEHFARLRAWGFTFQRFLVSWEAIEHAGPGLYDEAYLDYVRAVLEQALDYGITVFIDPHQDVWSRFSGGDGAPGWTFEVAGMDIRRFAETGAALVHATHGDPLPRMIWPTNEGKLANLTMWTLFFGGNDFAPETRVEGIPIQDYLQGHYTRAIARLAQRLHGLPNVAGYGTLNEPSAGMIGMRDLERRASRLPYGPCPTAFQAMRLGAGFTERVATWTVGPFGGIRTGTVEINAQGARAWLPDRDPIWMRHGVWELDERGQARLLRPDHFAHVKGHRVRFHRDYFRPFANRYARALREVHPEAILFIEGVPYAGAIPWQSAPPKPAKVPQAVGAQVASAPPLRRPAPDAHNVAHAPHWYDAMTLFLKRFWAWVAVDVDRQRAIFGAERVINSFTEQIARLMSHGRDAMNGVPTLIGEVGIPFDLGDKSAYRTGDFSRQAAAMDATMRALEANLASFTLWTYNPDNTNARGDLWNGEDFSIYSPDQRQNPADLNSGGRALEAVVRPYACKVAGTPLRMRFDMATGAFRFTFRHDPAVQAPTEIYLPRLHYPDGVRVQVSDGTFDLDWEEQRLRYRHTPEHRVHTVRVQRPGD
jgi:hypothetical protein